MNEHKEIRDALIAKQKELTGRLENIKSNITRGRSADSQEQAQELENAEVVDALGNEAQHELRLIARALDQIKNDSYGDCIDCGKPIPIARLRAQPYAERCIDCATAAERKAR
jgi:RNA polymerase-binding transcription factor DksA